MVGASLVAVLASVAVAAPVGAKIAPPWKNCAQVNARYPHGVGKARARDRTTDGDPVTNFKRSDRLYALAMANNRGLDRDRDGVACEKH